ncbi:MAG: beta-class carbonic anhydrase [Methanobacteriales archaeon]
MILNDIIIKNQQFVKNLKAEKLSHMPKKRLAIVTCMDTRLSGFLEPAMGLKRGDAKIIKNAGNRITEDTLRSLTVAIYSLAVEEVMVVGHTDCGMANVNFDKIRESMEAKGISKDVIKKLNLEEWIGAIDDEEKNVIESVKTIKDAEFIPEIPVHGLIIDINTGALKVLHSEK